jgi:hypothetical protein
VKPLSDEVRQQEADRKDDEQANPEEEQLKVSDEVYHEDTLLDVSSMLMAWDKGSGPLLLSGQTF